MRLSRDNPLIEDRVFEAGPRQARNRLIHITSIVKYSDNRSHQSRYGAAMVAQRVSVARYFTLAYTHAHPSKMHRRKKSRIESSASKSRGLASKFLQFKS